MPAIRTTWPAPADAAALKARKLIHSISLPACPRLSTTTHCADKANCPQAPRRLALSRASCWPAAPVLRKPSAEARAATLGRPLLMQQPSSHPQQRIQCVLSSQASLWLFSGRPVGLQCQALFKLGQLVLMQQPSRHDNSSTACHCRLHQAKKTTLRCEDKANHPQGPLRLALSPRKLLACSASCCSRSSRGNTRPAPADATALKPPTTAHLMCLPRTAQALLLCGQPLSCNCHLQEAHGKHPAPRPAPMARGVPKYMRVKVCQAIQLPPSRNKLSALGFAQAVGLQHQLCPRLKNNNALQRQGNLSR